MVKIEGLYNTAFCYTPVLEDAARAQIQSVVIKRNSRAARSALCLMSTLARAVRLVPP